MTTRKEAFEPQGVLKAGYHEALFNDLDKLAYAAGLGGAHQFIVQSAKTYLDAQEVANAAAVPQLLKQGRVGMLYASDVPHVAKRFMALTGAFMRNYVNARMMPLAQVLEEFRDHGAVDATILLIPDFHVPIGAGSGSKKGIVSPKDMERAARSTGKPQFVVDMVAGLLMQRLGVGAYTYLYSDDLQRLDQDYGPFVAKLLRENYDVKASAGEPLTAE